MPFFTAAADPNLPPRALARLSKPELAAHAAALPLRERVRLALQLQAEVDKAWLPRFGRLDAVLAEIPATPETVEALRSLKSANLRRALSHKAALNNGDSEAALVWALAESVAAFADEVLTPEQRAAGLAKLSDEVRGRALVLVSALARTEEEAQQLATAQGRLLASGPLTRGLLRTMAKELTYFDGAADLDMARSTQRAVGTELLSRLTHGDAAALDLEKLLYAQQLAGPTRLASAPSREGRRVLAKLYMSAAPLPELSQFGRDLAQRLSKRLLTASEEDAAPYVAALTGWGAMDLQQRAATMMHFLRDCSAVTGVPVPDLTVADFHSRDGDTYRGCVVPNEDDPRRSTIRMNTAAGHRSLDSFPETLSTLLHEFTHCRQRLMANAPSDAQRRTLPREQRLRFPYTWPDSRDNRILSSLFRANFHHYLTADVDPRAYLSQPVEREAFATSSIALAPVMQALSLVAARNKPEYLLAVAHRAIDGLVTLLEMETAPPEMQAEAAALRQRLQLARDTQQTERPMPAEICRAVLRDAVALGRRAAPVLGALQAGLEGSDPSRAAVLKRLRSQMRECLAQVDYATGPRRNSARPRPGTPLGSQRPLAPA